MLLLFFSPVELNQYNCNRNHYGDLGSSPEWRSGQDTPAGLQESREKLDEPVGASLVPVARIDLGMSDLTAAGPLSSMMRISVLLMALH